MKKEKHCSLKVRCVYLLVIMKMSKVIEFFNHIVMKLLLQEMLNLMKISWQPNLTIVPYSLCDPSLFVPSSIPILVSSSNDDSEDENPPPPSHLPPDESFELEPTPAPLLPRLVHST
jgi:hypothetical protein